ncbi:MAG: PEP-CTERM sorting domain-containing protein [Kiritimatiellia bacterium]
MTRIHSIVVGLLLAVSSLAGRAEVLWWSTGAAADITVTYEGSAETTTAEALGATLARIRYEDSTDYLPFVLTQDDGTYVTETGATVAKIPVTEVWTDIGTPGAGASFVVELGNWQDGSWTSLASATADYASLKDHIYTAPLSTPGYTPWIVTGFTATAAVPEPTSGLLALMGAALLALRRKRLS